MFGRLIFARFEVNHRGVYSRILAKVCAVAMATRLVKMVFVYFKKSSRYIFNPSVSILALEASFLGQNICFKNITFPRGNSSTQTLYCSGALARQLPILYNSEKVKSVGCKIEDMRSRLCFSYPGIPGCL